MNLIKRIFHSSRRILAKTWLGLHPNVKIIALTGSYGKTATATAIRAVLSEKFKTLQTDVNLDTLYNVPITALKLTTHDYLVFELGVDHPGEMDKHLEIVKPTVGVLTGITPVHADKEHLVSLKGIIREKSKLLSALPTDGLAIVNYDDEKSRKMAKVSKSKVWFYGSDPKNCQVWFDKVELSLEGTTLVLHHQSESVEVKLKLIGKHHSLASSAAAAVGLSQGLTLLEIARGLSKLNPLPGRMSLEKGFRGSLWLNDFRRANPASTISGLETVKDLEAKRKILVLGQMGELGDYEEESHRQVGIKVGEVKPDLTVTVGPATKYVIEETLKKLPSENVFYTENVFEAAKILKKMIRKDDLVYLKGSLLKHLERIPLILEDKKVDPDEIASHRYEIYT